MLLIIGLDGATWDLIDPWIAARRLPHLGRLRRQGLWGPLASTMPPTTFPSWSTFMTGVNPGKHGIFDFTRRQLGSYGVQFVNASFRKAPTIWKLLSDAGRRVGVLGVPGTYPPEDVNGCMISGFDTPVTTRADASFVSPPTLARLVEQLGGFPFADFQEFRVGPRWYRMALERLLHGIETKTRLALTLLSREDWDCFLLLFGESDTVTHHFWKFYDVNSPWFDADGAAEFGDAILRVYEALDAAIGALVGTAPGATVLVASDHGFGGAGSKAVYLNRWLAQLGLQRRYERAGSQLSARIKCAALQCVPTHLQAQLFRLRQGRWADWLESRSRFAGIDWTGTRAFSEELNYFPSVWLNLKGREPQGVVARADYRRLCDDICMAAEGLRDPEHGRPVVRRAWRREELYDGRWTEYAPDVILEFNYDGGYSYRCLSSASARTPEAVRVLGAGESTGGKLAGMSGSHRPEGIFLVSAEGLASRRGARRHVAIADMAPTILRVCGVDPPAGLDGRALDGVPVPSFETESPETEPLASERPYNPAQESEISARLAALGYLG
jgi:predicted AlkP superfamily phosphohydrolase/phosphomutase